MTVKDVKLLEDEIEKALASCVNAAVGDTDIVAVKHFSRKYFLLKSLYDDFAKKYAS